MSFVSSCFLVASLAALGACGGDLTLPGDGSSGGGGPPTGPESPSLTAAADGFSTLEGSDHTLSVLAPGVLGNDRVDGATGAGLEAQVVAEPSHGRLELRADGSLDYTPDPEWFGEDRFTYRAVLGAAASAEAEVVIQIQGLNDSPVFAAGPDQDVKREKKERDNNEREIEGWATAIRPGPDNEGDQAVTFLVDVTSGGGSLVGPPTVSPSGTLRYTPSDQEGIARVEVRLRDDGGTANGGNDTSQPHTLIITVAR